MIRQGMERKAALAALCLTILRAREEAAQRGMDEAAALEHEAEAVLAAFERGIRRAVTV